METTNRTAFVGPSRINNDDLFYLNTVVVDGKWSIFMGCEVKAIVQSLSSSIKNDKNLFVGTKGGQVLSNAKIPNTWILIVGNNSFALKFFNHNGDEIWDIAGDFTCQANDGTLRGMIYKVQ